MSRLIFYDGKTDSDSERVISRKKVCLYLSLKINHLEVFFVDGIIFECMQR